MPKKDRTFSEIDILRIITNNLDTNERLKVIITLCEGIVIERIKGTLVIVPVEDFRRELEETGIIETAIETIMLLFRKF